jgi:hypothetical protein
MLICLQGHDVKELRTMLTEIIYIANPEIRVVAILEVASDTKFCVRVCKEVKVKLSL